MKADLHCDDGTVVRVLWWDETEAPNEDKRVSVEGDLREYQGTQELHARTTRVERDLPTDRLARVVGYYLECVEAEAASDLSVIAGSTNHVVLGSGTAPMFSATPVPVPSTQRALDWCAQRQNAIGETLIVGYPVVVHQDMAANGRNCAVPLFISEFQLVAGQENRYAVQRLSEALDINPSALAALGLSRDEQNECLAALDGSPSFEEATSALDRLHSGLSILADTSGLAMLGPDHLSPTQLVPIDFVNKGVQNTCLLMITTGGATVTKKLVNELEQMLRQPELLSAGPLGVLLGATRATPAPLPQAHPIVVPSTLRQDQAVHSAMTSPFTVVTGPPGTGKSQVLVNVIAASIVQGQSVLFASKNNKAVNVVFDRIREVSPRSTVMRAGNASMRGELAASIGNALNQVGAGPDLAHTRFQQRGLENRLNAIYQKLQEKIQLENQIKESRAQVDKKLASLPAGADLDKHPAELDAALIVTSEALRSFSGSLPFFRRNLRWRIHQSRLDGARSAGEAINRLLTTARLGHLDIENALREVSAKPKRSYAPAHAIKPVTEVLAKAKQAREVQAECRALEHRLKTDFQTWTIEDQLAAVREERLRVGRVLIDGSWDTQLTQHPAAVEEARHLQADLQAAAGGGAGARTARTRMSRVLDALPAWGVTNLSAGTNFPLEHQMFDLVVIDEASQCDVASALPLLFRAKRALIIGDQRQLIHITQLSKARDAMIAQRWQLPAPVHAQFDYRAKSTFTLSALRVGEPLLLDLHFRSQAGIIGFSNKQFYNRRLEVCTSPSSDRMRIEQEPTLRWRDVDGDVQRGQNGRSWRNRDEALAVVQELGALLPTLHGTGQTVGVVSPYRAQVEEIRRGARGILGDVVDKISIETAHRFQGDERDIMLFSPVIGPSMTPQQAKFAADRNLVNVALTRARRRLIVVGNRSACLRDNTVISEFARYVARIEASAFDSPLELELFEALLERGVVCQPGKLVGAHRLDLAIEKDLVRLDVECDGAAFHTDSAADRARDAQIRLHGWRVLRFSGRELSRDIAACVARVIRELEKP